MSTVGYGDLYLAEQSTLYFGCVFISCSCMILAVTVGNIVEDYISNLQRGQLRRSMQSLTSEKFGEKWMNRLMGQIQSQSQSNPLSMSYLTSTSQDQGEGEMDSRYIQNIRVSSEMDPDWVALRGGGSSTTNNTTQTQQSLSKSASVPISTPIGCNKERFVLFVLSELGVLDYTRDIKPLFRKFRELDQGQKNYLDRKVSVSIYYIITEWIQYSV